MLFTTASTRLIAASYNRLATGLLIVALLLGASGGSPRAGTYAAPLQAPQLKWQNGGCYSSWCETGWYSSPAVESIKRYAKEMDRLGVLPTPFPLKSVLTKENMRRVYRLFGVTGLSYGNLSAREKVGGFGNSTFWMTGRGVDKAHLERPGKDIFLVKGLDTRGEKVLVSAPPDYNRQARVSVDAIEHALIYEAFPKVEAIMHIHAWINGAIETRQSYPCGTIEMAKEVVSILKTSGHPEREAVGLINHGLTLTGNSFEDIFDRIWDHLIKEIPLAA